MSQTSGSASIVSFNLLFEFISRFWLNMKWGSKWWVTPTMAVPILGPDTIHAYLAELPISPHQLLMFGGLIGYWFQQEDLTPSLARMGSDYCSAPGMFIFCFSLVCFFGLISSQRHRSILEQVPRAQLGHCLRHDSGKPPDYCRTL
jgi:predicted cation transporter